MISNELTMAVADRVLLDQGAMMTLKVGEAWRVQTVNLHHLALAKRSETFASAIRRATWVTADGWPVVALLRTHGIRASRVTGSAWARDLVASRSLSGHRIGLLGGSQETGRRLEAAIGDALVFRDHRDKREWTAADLITGLNAAGVQLLLIAVTPPDGDLLAATIHESGFPGSVVAVGGGLDMAVGLQPTAPTWISKLGLEWAYRLAAAPRRLGRRYILECIPFLLIDLVPSMVTTRVKRGRMLRAAETE